MSIFDVLIGVGMGLLLGWVVWGEKPKEPTLAQTVEEIREKAQQV